MSITGLHWLDDRDRDVPGLPGQWHADGEAVYIGATRADGLTVDGAVLQGTVVLHPAEGAPGLIVAYGDRRIEIVRRTGAVALRVHDPAAPTLTTFRGIPAWEPAEKWVVPGRFTPYEQDRTVTTGAVVPGLEHHHAAVGEIEFELDGRPQRLIAFRGANDALTVLFTDETSGVTTYPAARTLAVPAPDARGRVVLDFTRASNLPCAVTDFATCPVAPPENRLSVAVEAGEKLPLR